MKCEGVRALGIEALKSQSPEIEAHTASCAACSAELRETAALLSLLHEALPDIQPTPGTLKKIEARLPKPALAFGLWIRVAAAASVLVAIVSFLALAALPRATEPAPVVVETGRRIPTDRPFRAERFTTLLLPDIGTLRVDENSVIRFDGPRSVVLESGQVFADILPSGKGFEIRAAQAVARVHGTRFGVTAPATVYVVEGKVEVETSAGRLHLGPTQGAVGSRMVELDDPLRWLAEHERPAVRLRLDPRGQDTVTPGAPLKWHLILETDAVAPLHLGRRRDFSQYLSLVVGDAQVPLDPNAARPLEIASSPNGLTRLDVAHRCVIEIDVDPALFREKGRVPVRAAYTSGAHAPPGAWVGSARSESVHVEVR
ncbi:MAG TPA: FecR family protein [Planctomycetota bacterium]